MLTIIEVQKIHAILIEKFGGSNGVRDLGLLESALNRPFATFEQQELYPGAIDKAAAILESILMNHHLLMATKEQVLFWQGCC